MAAAARRRRLLLCARQEFHRHGFSRLNLDEIVRKAGGSKASIAKFFHNKAGLVAAVIELETQEQLAGLDLPESGRNIRERLEDLATALLRMFLLPQALMAYRAAVGEGHRDRAVAEAFYHAGRGTTVAAIAQRLERWTREGLIACEQPIEDADRLTHILRSGIHERILLGLCSPRVTTAEFQRCVRGSVEMFLHGVSAAKTMR